MLYVYTSIVNGFDNLRPPAAPASEFVRYICFTNIPNLPRVTPWEYRPVYDVGVACRTARVPKILPHLMLPEDAEYSIYHDGNFQLRKDPIVIVEELLSSHDMAIYKHPARNCIYQEADVLLREKIGTPELIQEQVARYRESGFPDNAGLWANGLLIRRHNEAVAALNERWWQMYAEGCERDQLAFAPARFALDCPIRTIDGNVYSSPYVLNRWHAAFRHRDDNSDYWEQRNRQRARLGTLAKVTGTSAGVEYVNY